MTTKTHFNKNAINKIKLENKKHTISKLKTGDLVKTKAMLDKIMSFASSDPIAAQAQAELA